jgi:hypothetical protein
VHKDPALVDEWHVDSPGRTVTYTISAGISNLVFVYDCQLFENMHTSSASQTIVGDQLSRVAVEKLPKFVSLLAGELPLSPGELSKSSPPSLRITYPNCGGPSRSGI